MVYSRMRTGMADAGIMPASVMTMETYWLGVTSNTRFRSFRLEMVIFFVKG